MLVRPPGDSAVPASPRAHPLGPGLVGRGKLRDPVLRLRGLTWGAHLPLLNTPI